MQGLPKILVVEDERDLAELYQQAIGEKALVLIAFNTDEAVLLHRDNPGLDGIMMDGDLPGEHDSIELVLEWKRSFAGPFAAISGGSKQESLLSAGCNFNLRKPVSVENLMAFVSAVVAYRTQR